jgi:hypothetical protein
VTDGGNQTDQIGQMTMLIRTAAAAVACCFACPAALGQQADEKPFRLQTALDLPDC